jgi:hypothetical protein
MESLPNPEVLLLVDVQQGFDAPTWGRRNTQQWRSASRCSAWRRATVRSSTKHVDRPTSPCIPTTGNAFRSKLNPAG